MKQWHLVYCKPRQEHRAQSHLDDQRYTTYLPRLVETRRHRGKLTQVIRPLFPRYLFIQLDNLTDNWGPIRSTLGVHSLVTFRQTPALVPDQVIQFLKDREDENGLHHLRRPALEPGSRIRILEGPMKGHEAIFLARSGKDRVLILLKFLGHTTRAEIGVKEIEPCPEELRSGLGRS
jgi:transcriptional antiterminator RfaH